MVRVLLRCASCRMTGTCGARCVSDVPRRRFALSTLDIDIAFDSCAHQLCCSISSAKGFADGNQSAFVCSGDVLSKSSSAEPNAETAAGDEITRLATKMCRCGIYLSCVPLQITRCFFRVWLQRVSQHSNAQQQIELSGDTLPPHLLDSMGQPSRRNVPKVPSCSSAHASAIQSDDTPLIAPSSSPCRRNVPRILPLLSAALMHNNCDADAAFQGFLLLCSFLCRFLVMRFISGHVFKFNYCWV